MKFLITGTTGRLGGLIIEFLAKKVPATDIIAGTTNPASEKATALKEQGFEIRRTDFEDQASLVEAFTGVDKVYIVSTFPDVEMASRQQTNIVEAVKQTGIKQMVYSSAPNADVCDFFLAAHHQVRENIIKESGIPYVFLRNNRYIENKVSKAQASLNGALWVTAAGNGQVGWVSRADLAEATANVLAGEGHDNKTYELGGENLTQADFVAALNEVTGKDIQVKYVDDAAFLETLNGKVPEQLASMLAMTQIGIREGKSVNNSTDLELLLGRKPMTVKEALQQVLA